jgi:hypothetical protein
MKVVNAVGADIWEVQPDVPPYDPYPDGPSAFHVIYNVPSYTGNGIDTITMRTSACYWDPFALMDVVDDSHSVTLREDPADNGIFRIDDSVSYTTDYVYVGSDFTNVPAPGGNTDVGLRVAWNPNERLYVYFPASAGATCDPWSDNDVQNFGSMCTQNLQTGSEICQRNLALGGWHSAEYNGWCYSDNRTDSGFFDDYYARDYNFTLTDTTYVNIEMTSPGRPGGSLVNAVVYLTNSTGAVIEWDDNSRNPGLSTDARIIRWLPKGDYTIEATTGSQWEWGDFTVTLTDQEPLCPLAAINLGDTVKDVTSADCGLTEYYGPSGEMYTKHYELTLGVPTDVMFIVNGNGTLGPPAMPAPYILVYDKADMSHPIAWEGADSLMIPALPAGTYIIEVMDSIMMNTVYGFDLSVFTYQTLSAVDSGWYEYNPSAIPVPTYIHNPSSTNYIAGDLSGMEYRDFFVFDLSGVSGTIVNAALDIENPPGGYVSADGSETWTVYDVNVTSIANLVGAIDNATSFNDIGSGTSYGSANVVWTGVTTPVNVNLNASAVSALNSAIGGQFALGGRVTTIGALGDEYVFGGSSSAYSRTLTLIIKP